MTVDPGRILVVLHGSIGDVTRALPLANLIRRAFPNSNISWSVEPLAYPLVENHPAVDRVILFDRSRWWRTLVPFLAELRSGNFDLILDLQRHLKSGLISWWTRAPVRIGFHRRDAKEGNWIFNNFHIPSGGNGISKLGHYLKFAEFLGIAAEPLEWRMSLTPEEQGNVKELLRDTLPEFAVFFVGSSWESKKWFPSETAHCAAAVRQNYGLGSVLLGGKEDIPFARQVEAEGKTSLVNLVGRTSLRESVGVLSKARVSIGPDSGLMHLSCAVGTPVVSLWGATDPERTGPYGCEDFVVRGNAACSPCYLRRCPIGRLCMRNIDMGEILAKVGKVLSEKRDRLAL